ncbi:MULTISPECIES: DNA polymerase III subunit alpha [Pseudarthrobacter]|uniref:DNA polymerase III subunit alpha n=2 Tax=Pseudarthrobacter TaxID=1742993 RepID=A0ABQ1Y0Z6_9MICC|nr:MULTISPECIES: DNA polymerase III subunit alpha [Pseudarthrobacter]MBD1539914.1 DNA polymerase III subunit alpha [Arthrobacter sp. S13_S34]MBD1593858.1 DNA polymerase III subunit alpha [Arthrobacter sp. S1_S22]GGH08251.1 DNA-directed DNA polymerase [Pseudarthrobacter polychromogenes]GGI94946.1 DNA-directed DNA polymerase [Pseudarthrobacter scleromae]
MTSSNDSFVHLHNHTEYSMLDGAARLGELFDETERLGMPALATTDHGYLFGAFDFWKKATDKGIKPIIGVEAYVTPGTARGDKSRVRWGEEHQRKDDISGGGSYTHMTLLSYNNAGMRNLFRASSIASLDAVFGKWPRLDRELLNTYSEGLIATTGCPSGEIQTRLRLGQYREALEAAAEFRDIFGAENYFCELMDHGLDIERRVTGDLLRLAKDLNLPLVATNDLHYTHEHDAKAHEALLAIQSGSTLLEPTYDNGGSRFAFSGSGYYLKSPQEMRELFRDHPDACDNTLLIAERCEVSFNTGANYMPRFPCPPGEDETSWLVKEVATGLEYRYPGGVPDDVRAQADYELGVITSMGFPGYFLVVADFINWAKNNGIRVGPGRGSGAGSMVAYAMRITDLDPLRHGLIFERFLNPDRVSMPDFDVDFDDRRRSEVIDYVTRKYGDERVAMIVTYGTIKTKQALKDSSRVLGYPFSMGEQLTKALPPAVMAKDIPLADIQNPEAKRYGEAGDFRQLISTDPEAAKVFETALGIEGLKRQWGVHAAGVIMSSDPIIDVIPIMRRIQDGQVITQFDYPTCEGLGLIKMDFLGLRNLTIISDALENIKMNRGIDLDLESLELDDAPSYELLARGDTLGVFQLDGGPMRSLLKLMKPDNFEDISAVLALYRPGPMGANAHTDYALRKNGIQEVIPIHPELKEPLAEILGGTYGLIVYQEQVMAVAQKLAGYSLGQADILRRAMGKKKKSELDKQFAGFSQGMQDNGYSMEAVKTLWDILLPFSDYAFNKAHSAAYGVISYWTAYLKAHYAPEYMAALLTSVGDDKDKSAIYLNECRRMGITVLPPDVNESALNFTPVGNDIRFGMGAIRNVGVNVVEAMVAARESEGAYTSFKDYLMKVPAVVCNKRTIESLIKSGAFDSLGHHRRALAMIHEEAIDSVITLKRNEAIGQFDLFAGFDEAESESSLSIEIPDLPEWEKKDKLSFERDMLGLYVSDHPLQGLEGLLSQHAEMSITSVLGEDGPQDGAIITIAGMITSLSRRIAKASGNAYARAEVEDLGGSMEVMFFGQVYGPIASVLAEDLIVVVKGRLQKRDDGAITLNCMELSVPDLSEGLNGPLVITMPTYKATEAVVTELGDVLRTHRGNSEVRLHLQGDTRTEVMGLPVHLRVNPSPSLFGDLKVLLGPACLDA